MFVSYDMGGRRGVSFSYPMFERLRVRDRVELFAASAQFPGTARFGNGEAERVYQQSVTGNFFPVLGLRIYGRLAPGATAESARGAMQAAFTNARREWAPLVFGKSDAPELRRRFEGAVLALEPGAGGHSRLRQEFARPLWVLGLVAGLVLLIACSNLSNLFTARATARRREMALRASIGAGRARLVQQVVVEGAMLAAAACALGLAFGAAVAPGIVAMLGPSRQPVFLDLHVTWRMAAFALAAGGAATLLFAPAPALRASAVAPNEALKAGGGKISGRRAALRPMLAAQIALSFAVLFVGGLFLLSFENWRTGTCASRATAWRW